MKLYGKRFKTVLNGQSMVTLRVRFWVLGESLAAATGTHCMTSTIRVLPVLVSTEDA